MSSHPSTSEAWARFAREIGHNFSRARADLGLSQEEVASRAGISSFTYQKYEKGESRPGSPLNLQLKTLVAVSQALESSLIDLLPSPLPDMTSGR